MRMGTFLFLGSLLCTLALADDDADRAKLIGSWQDGSGPGWTFAQQGDSLRVTQTDGDNKVGEFVCATDGKTCEVKESGKKVSVSMWFNGPKLVEMVTKGSEVIERKFSILAAADSMQLEIVPIAPGGKAETVTFKRSTVASAKR